MNYIIGFMEMAVSVECCRSITRSEDATVWVQLRVSPIM